MSDEMSAPSHSLEDESPPPSRAFELVTGFAAKPVKKTFYSISGHQPTHCLQYQYIVQRTYGVELTSDCRECEALPRSKRQERVRKVRFVSE
jgi:hypothetical protein